MNYGWHKDAPNWKEDRKILLAERLCRELPANMGWTPGGVTPYIELDGLYNGVRIRKITNLSEEDLDEFINRADKIYEEIMNTPLEG